jgi:hypothetical protein
MHRNKKKKKPYKEQDKVGHTITSNTKDTWWILKGDELKWVPLIQQYDKDDRTYLSMHPWALSI